MKLHNEDDHEDGVLPNDVSRVGFYLEAGIIAELERREAARKQAQKKSALDKALPGFSQHPIEGEMLVPVDRLIPFVDDLEERLGVEWEEVEPFFAEREWNVTVFGEMYTYSLYPLSEAERAALRAEGFPNPDPKYVYEWDGHRWEGAEGHR